MIHDILDRVTNDHFIDCLDIGQPSFCLKDSVDYGTELNLTYLTFENDGITQKEKISLKLGENLLSLAGEKVGLTKIYTRWNNICFKINTTRKADYSKTEIKLKTSGFKALEKSEFFFTSEDNSYGVINNKFMDGKIFSTQLTEGKWKEIHETGGGPADS